jgi:predicted nucleotidyltransferase
MKREELRHLLFGLRDGLRSLYQGRLRGLYLFGSYSRGEEDPESDVDILIVLDRIERYGDEVERTSSLASSLSLQYGVSVSRLFVDERSWTEGHDSFLENVRSEAVAA